MNILFLILSFNLYLNERDVFKNKQDSTCQVYMNNIRKWIKILAATLFGRIVEKSAKIRTRQNSVPQGNFIP